MSYFNYVITLYLFLTSAAERTGTAIDVVHTIDMQCEALVPEINCLFTTFSPDKAKVCGLELVNHGYWILKLNRETCGRIFNYNAASSLSRSCTVRFFDSRLDDKSFSTE
ncbi:hypothetical protein ANN_15107 [Periplaneta americana]|uniref:Secreted protein n=1 Tax=Periplaneta americana TaxID=6978 RepID=A0ABQ8SY63_PERAM|nr:hypothetical protein ANN_15107 [Periplaneta americana]